MSFTTSLLETVDVGDEIDKQLYKICPFPCICVVFIGHIVVSSLKESFVHYVC